VGECLLWREAVKFGKCELCDISSLKHCIRSVSATQVQTCKNTSKTMW